MQLVGGPYCGIVIDDRTKELSSVYHRMVRKADELVQHIPLDTSAYKLHWTGRNDILNIHGPYGLATYDQDVNGKWRFRKNSHVKP